MTMKKLMLFLYSSLLFTGLMTLNSCQEDVTKTEKPAFRLDPSAMISIKPDVSAFPQSIRFGVSYLPSQHLSALEIVKYANVIAFYNEDFGTLECSRVFEGFQRDTISERPCLKMWGTDIIDVDGNYVPDFIEGRDFLIKHLGDDYTVTDTLAYIPNSVISAARDSIKAAMIRNDTEAVYRIFNDAFIFTPITGEEWLELKRQGLQ